MVEAGKGWTIASVLGLRILRGVRLEHTLLFNPDLGWECECKMSSG